MSKEKFSLPTFGVVIKSDMKVGNNSYLSIKIGSFIGQSTGMNQSFIAVKLIG